MLLQFVVENFTSFKGEAMLDLRPAKSRLKRDHIIEDTDGRKVGVLPIQAVYGANASGKTNLVAAIAFARQLILRGVESDAPTGAIPFRLDSETETGPSRFEFIFKHEGVLYTYGFLVSAEQVHEEWLFAYFTNRESMIFERITRDGRAIVESGTRLAKTKESRQFINFIAQSTRPNQLFLYEAHEKNVDLVAPVKHWFADHLRLILPNSRYHSLALQAHSDQEFTSFLSNFLKAADTGIQGISTHTEPLDLDRHFPDLPDEMRQDLLKDLTGEKSMNISIQAKGLTYSITKPNGVKPATLVSLKTAHIASDGSEVLFDTDMESDGTRRLMELLPAVLDTWKNERVYIIDELDRSLHPHLCRLFVEACLRGVTDHERRGQFVMTMHETSLLDRDLLRRDEIAFMEKDEGGASRLRSMAEYSVPDKVNYRRGYMNGRFGGVPMIADADTIQYGG